MTRMAFGNHSNRLGGEADICCAIGCDEESVIAAGTLPMCENHMINAYRKIGDYLRSLEERASDGEAKIRRWLMVYEIIRQPHGLCPQCDWFTLCRVRETGEVLCMRATECGYACTAEEFIELTEARIKKASEQQEVVYYVRFGDRVKIGTTKNLADRIASIPHDEVMATEPGGVYVERQRHTQFKHLRADVGRGREWFRLTPELAEHIAAVKSRQAA